MPSILISRQRDVCLAVLVCSLSSLLCCSMWTVSSSSPRQIRTCQVIDFCSFPKTYILDFFFCVTTNSTIFKYIFFIFILWLEYIQIQLLSWETVFLNTLILTSYQLMSKPALMPLKEKHDYMCSLKTKTTKQANKQKTAIRLFFSCSYKQYSNFE